MKALVAQIQKNISCFKMEHRFRDGVPPIIIDFDNNYTKLMEEIGKKERYAFPLTQIQPGNSVKFTSKKTQGLLSRISKSGDLQE